MALVGTFNDPDQDACREWVRERADVLEGLDLPIFIVRAIREKPCSEFAS